MEHVSVWLATAALPRFTALDRDLEVDVAVVGAGLVGLTTALLAQRDGARVAVLEAGQVGSGTTGHTTGKVTAQHTLAYASLVGRHGEERARSYAEANQAGVEQVARLAAELEIDCALTRAPAYAYTRRAELRQQVADEVAAARRLGLPASLSETTDLPFPIEAAVRFDDQVHFHAGRYVAGLARAVAAAGGLVFDHTRVLDIRERARTAVLTTASATVHAGQVVLATLLPIRYVGGYFARTRPARSYGIAVRLRGPAPTSMAISIDSPTRSTRPWLGAGPNGLIVVGNGGETGKEGDTAGTYADLDSWTRSTFDVEAVDFGWSGQDYATSDQIPYVGRAQLTHRILVATGFRKWGLSNGAAAAAILADLIAGRDNPWLRVFDATRIGDPPAVARQITDNVKVGVELVTGHLGSVARAQLGRFTGSSAPPAESLGSGQGGLVNVDGRTVGAYRDAEGRLHAVKPTCTHLGCRLHWNAAETSWDCACHGSRFDYDGAILNGPAVRPLARIALDQRPPRSQPRETR